MTKAMILSEIENMDSWLKKADLMEDDNNKMIRKLIYTILDLCSPVVKMAGSGEDSKEKLLSFLVDVAAFGGDDMKQLCRFLAEMASLWEDCSPDLVGMEDSGEENLYSFLVGNANSVTDIMKKVLVGIGTVNEESMNSLLIAMADLGQDNKEKLYTLLVEMMDLWDQHKEKQHRSVIWKGDISENEKKFKLYVFLDGIMDSCKVGPDYGRVSKRKQLDFLKRLVKSLKDNNETVEEESVYSLQNDIEEGNKIKLYNSLSEFIQDPKEKVYRWLIGKGDSENGKKIKLYSLVDRMTDFCRSKRQNMYNLLVRVEDPWKYNDKTLYKSLNEMADLGEDDRETVYSLVVEMADAWEHINKIMLYSLLARVWKEKETMFHLLNNQELHSLLVSLVVEISDLWDWEDKEKLQTLVVEVTDTRFIDHSLVVQMAALWEGNLINKVKLNSWLANNTHNLEPNQVFRLLLHVSLFCNEHSSYTMLVRAVRNHLRSILDIITDNTSLEEEQEEGSGLCCLIYEVLEIAHHARNFLIRNLDSDPIVLLSQIFNRQNHDLHYISCDFNQSLRNMSKDVMRGLKEMEERIHKEIRVGRSMTPKNVGEFSTWEGGENIAVGLEEDIKLLLEDIHTVTYIRGMGGIGKTTLARELYNHPAVVDQFECRVWVCVSQQLSRKEFFIKVLRQVVDGKEFERGVPLEKMDNKSLIAMLHQHLERVRYFIVLDDVQRDPYMNLVFESLPIDKGSRLLFTTRIPGVEFISHGDYTEHKMKFLKEHESWELLLKTLFFGISGKKFPKQLEKRGRRVLEKCNGLPLAIKEVGRRWADMIQSGCKWEELLESIDLSATLEVLDKSYQNWCYQMKSQFVRLSFFKEDTTIRVTKLKHILVVLLARLDLSFRDSDLHDLSEEYVIEIKNTTKTRNVFKMFRIYPVFHRLSIAKANDEINLEILNKNGNNQHSHEPRHRVIYCSREKFDYSTNQDKDLVSLFFYGGGYLDTSPSYWKNFEKLKILDMEDFGLKILPDAVGTLLELKYLGLRNNYIQEIPASLGHLENLEVLDIAQNIMVEVPDIIWEMDSLRHLYMSSIISFQQPLKIDGLMNLWTLSYISVHSWTHGLSNIETMSSLYRLGIEEVDGNTDVSTLFVSLVKLRNLYFLTLRGFCFRRMPSLDELGILQELKTLKLDGLLTRLPSVTNFPPNITCLSLVNSSLDEDPMPILEKLSNLCILKLQNAYTGQQMVISAHGFANLEYLYIGELWHLRTIQVGEGGMLKLEEIEINNCPYLETLPEEIWSKELKMVTTKNIAKKLRKSRSTSGMTKVDIQP